MDVDEELSKLQPSQRLINHYRDKISKLNTDNEQLKQLLEQYKKIVEPTFGELERQQMTREMIELQSALSDVNIFIHAERQQVARLYEENERLQLDCLENEKKIAMLLSLSGLSENELQIYLKDPKKINIIKQKLPPHFKQLRQKLLNNAKKPDESEMEIALRARVASLEKQLEDSEKNWQREKHSLLEDRTLQTSEHKAQILKDEAHVKLLTARLDEAQRLVAEAMKETMAKHTILHDSETQWLAERDHLLSVLTTIKDSLPALSHLHDFQTIERSGSYTDLVKPKSSCELKDLRRQNESLKRELDDAENLKTMYESQCLEFEQKMCKLREQKENAEQIYKGRNKKLMNKIETLKQDYVKLEERRINDLKGFQTEIKFIRNDIKTLVHQLYKITVSISGNSENIDMDLNTVTNMQAISTLTRTVHNTLADLKRRVFKIDADLANPDTFDPDIFG